MSNVLFCMPIKSGKMASFKAFINECLEEKREEYKDLLLRYNLNTLQMWIHTVGSQDYAMFTHDMGDEAQELLKGWGSSKHPFDHWFNVQLEDCYDIPSMNETPPQPVFFGELDARKA